MSSDQLIPFGVDFMDYLTGGGMLPGESALLSTPAGGGRTLLALRMAWAEAKAERQVGFIPLEQTVEGHLHHALMCLASGSKRSDWEAFKTAMTKSNSHTDDDVEAMITQHLPAGIYNDVLRENETLNRIRFGLLASDYMRSKDAGPRLLLALIQKFQLPRGSLVIVDDFHAMHMPGEVVQFMQQLDDLLNFISREGLRLVCCDQLPLRSLLAGAPVHPRHDSGYGAFNTLLCGRHEQRQAFRSPLVLECHQGIRNNEGLSVRLQIDGDACTATMFPNEKEQP